ncbi:hypothetical protein [Sorangium sp. So ce426]|uniref:hypothetical protein n=1 Tax=Sorangium sp. So ce426 TaxID=3133312 RepID=UPI003F5C098E
MLDIYDRRIPVNNVDAGVRLPEHRPLESLKSQLIRADFLGVGAADVCRATGRGGGQTSDHQNELTGDHIALLRLCRMHLELLSGEANHAVHANSMRPKCLNPI